MGTAQHKAIKRTKAQEMAMKRASHCAKRYDLLWFVGGQCKEVLLRNETKTIVAWEKLKKGKTTHKIGKLVPVETGTHKY